MEDGNTSNAPGVNETATDRTLAEEKAARAVAEAAYLRLAAVLEQIPVSVSIAEAPTGRVIFSNSKSARDFRHDPSVEVPTVEDYAGFVGYFCDGRRYRADEWPLARSLLTGEVVRGEEIEIEGEPGGGRVTIVVNSSPIRDEKGHIVAAVTVFDDITERKRTGEEHRRLAEERAQLFEAERRARHHAERQTERLARLQNVTEMLAGAATEAEVGRVILDELVPATGARAAVLFFLTHEGTLLEAVERRGVYATLPARPLRFTLDEELPLVLAVRSGEPVWIHSLAEMVERFPAVPLELLAIPRCSWCVLPLVSGAARIGALALSFAERQEFSEEDRNFFIAMVRQGAQALERARLRAEERLLIARSDFLAEAGALLASSLDYQTTLGNIAHLAVPLLADSISIDLEDELGQLRQVAVAHLDPEREQLIRALRRDYPPDRQRLHPLLEVVRTGQSLRVPHMPAGAMEQYAVDPTHLALLRDIGTETVMLVPLWARDHGIGALSLGRMRGGAPYEESDLRLAEELARRAALAVENARLYQEAQKAVGMRDDFLSIASHELRTPLTSMRLHVQSLLRVVRSGLPIGTEQLTSQLGATDRQVSRLVQLVDELLDLSRLSAGRLRLVLEEADLASIARDVAAHFAELFTNAGSTLRVRADQPVKGIWDRMRLDQVLTNLLSNAVKYGGGLIELDVGAEAGWARATVRDHGIGIAPADQERVFGRFERAVTKKSYGGFGLGLWITRQLVEAMGGTIRVASELGAGAAFTIELPQHPPATDRFVGAVGDGRDGQ